MRLTKVGQISNQNSDPQMQLSGNRNFQLLSFSEMSLEKLHKAKKKYFLFEIAATVMKIT
jgi:hypothetical protein